MKKLIKFIRILFKKKISEEDLVDIWLILFFNQTVQEQAEKYDNMERSESTHKFHMDHKVSQWQYNIWKRIAYFKIRRIDAQWFVYMREFKYFRFPVIERYITSKYMMEHGWWAIELQCSPSIKLKSDD